MNKSARSGIVSLMSWWIELSEGGEEISRASYHDDDVACDFYSRR